MKRIFLSIFVLFLVSLFHKPISVFAQVLDCEREETCVFYGEGWYECSDPRCQVVWDGAVCIRCEPIPTNTPTPTPTSTPIPTPTPTGCAGYTCNVSLGVPFCTWPCVGVMNLDGTCHCESPPPTPTPAPVIGCWCPHACHPGWTGCWEGTSGPYSCQPECCTPEGCPVEPTLPPSGFSHVDFSELIGIATPNFSSLTRPGDIITILLPYIYGAAGLAMLLYLVLGAYQIMISSGDPKQMAAGREKITYAIVGFIIMFAAYWITRIAGEILNIQQILDIFG